MVQLGVGDELRIGRGSIVARAGVLGLLLVSAVGLLAFEGRRFDLGIPAEAEVERFAADLERSLAQGDLGLLRGRLSTHAIVTYALKGTDPSPERVKRLAHSFAGGIPGYLARLADQVGPQGRFTVVRRQTGPRPALWLRMSGRGLGYLRLDLRRDSLGRVIVVDLISLLGGTSFVDTLRREKSPALRALLREVGGLIGQGRFRDAAARCERAPAELRADPELLRMRLRAAAELKGDEGEAAFDAALDALQAASDPEGEADLSRFGFFWRRGQDAEALALLDRLSERVGGDVALDALRARVHLSAGRTERAGELVAQTRAALPRDPYVLQSALLVALVGQRWPDAVDALRALRELGLELEALGPLPNLKALRASEPYREWTGG